MTSSIVIMVIFFLNCSVEFFYIWSETMKTTRETISIHLINAKTRYTNWDINRNVYQKYVFIILFLHKNYIYIKSVNYNRLLFLIEIYWYNTVLFKFLIIDSCHFCNYWFIFNETGNRADGLSVNNLKTKAIPRERHGWRWQPNAE